MAADEVRAKLAEIADLQTALPARRAEAVAEARAAGLYWSEIAGILGMTEHGLIKADKKWREAK